MAIKRSPSWLTAELDTFLREHAQDKFAWGVQDCCLFAANAIQAMTGEDIADDFRGKYTDQASAFGLVKSLTGGTTVADAAEYCAKKHGLVEWADKSGKPLPLMAKRGDLCTVLNGENVIAGVVDLSGKFVACMGDGVVRIPVRQIQRAWHVPA